MVRPFLFAVSLALLLAGCSGGGQQASSGTSGTTATGNAPAPEEKPFKAALLTPGPVSDAGWSAIAFNGLKEVEKELGAHVTNEEATGTKITDSLRSYAQDGYQLVFGHGYEYNEPMTKVAADFPNTVFVSSSGGMTAKNVGAFRFYLEQGFYCAGVMAAEMTKTNKIATVALDGIPSIDSTLKAFSAGAKSVKPNIIVINMKIASDKDISAAQRSTLEAIDQGADFVIHQANAAAQGVFDACKSKNVYAFGANFDQNNQSAVIGSAVINASPAFVDLAKRVKEGKYEGKIELFGMEQGAIEFILNPALKEKVPAKVQKDIEELAAKIKSGEVVVPKDEF